MLYGLLLIAAGVGLLLTAGAFRRDATAAHEALARSGHSWFDRFRRLRGGLPRLTAVFGRGLGAAAIVVGTLAVAGVLELD